ncbi:MAG TPA: hypothetical protein VFV78_13090 [Vicinamibacterales bacterium]|nr:hypothetical protein [Vicinamibacterales bacterium]
MSKAARAVGASMAITLVMIGLATHTLLAQTPTVLMFHGDPLKQPIVLTDADAALFRNLLNDTTIKVADLANRPYRQVAIFWASRSNPANNGTPVEKLTPQMAWMHGRLYLPVADKPAVLLTTRMTKQAQAVPIPADSAAFVQGGPVSDAALAILKQKGVLPR